MDFISYLSLPLYPFIYVIVASSSFKVMTVPQR